MSNVIKNILLLTLLFTFGVSSVAHAQTKASFSHKKIVAQGSDNYPPFEFINESGEPDGFNVDLFRAVMQAADMPYEIQLCNWEDAINNMYANNIDALVGMIFSEERANNVRFCLPHCEVNRNIICRSEDTYTTMESLSGKEVVVQRGGWSEKYSQEIGLTDKLIIVDDMREALLLLESGKYDAAIGSDLVAISIIKQENFKKLKIHQTLIEPQQYSIVVSHHNETLLRLINMGLQELKVSGEYDKIYNKWFGVYSKSSRISKIIYYSLGLALILVVISLSIVTILRRKILQATKSLDMINTDLQLSLKAGEVSAWKYNPDGGVIRSLHGETFAANGISLSEFKAMLHPDDANRVIETIQKMESGELKTIGLTFRLRTLEETYLYIKSEMIVELNGKSSVKSIIGTQKDVTQEQKKEDEKKEVVSALRMAIKAASLYVWYYDVESDLYFALRNEKVIRTRYHQASIISHLHPDDAKLYQSTCNDMLSGKIDNILIILRIYNPKTKDYSYIESSLSAVHNDAGEIYRLAINQRDISEKCRKKLELDSAHKSLEMAMEAAELITWDYNIATKKHRILYGHNNEPLKYNNNLDLSYCHLEDQQLYNNAINQVAAGVSDKETITVRKIKEDGQYGYFDCTLSSIKNTEGKVLNLIGSFRDISTRIANEIFIIKSNKELEQVNRKIELILNNINSGLAYINKDYVVEWENISICSASLSLEAYKKGGKCYKTAHNRDTPCENCVLQRALQSRNVERIEFTFNNKDTIEVFATPVINISNEVEGIVIRLDDITERKQFYLDLADAKEKAERSDKLKSAFLANMSHEIRTPLNAIIGFSELIISNEDPKDKEEYSRIINTNNELLLKLINDILELSKIESGVVSVKIVEDDFASCFNDIATMMRPRVKDGVELICDNPYSQCILEFDKERLTQVVTNLLTNAIKFTSKGYIKMGYESTDKGIRVYVNDTGIGITQENMPKVFARFEKINLFAQGTGLGMAICKAIIESLGGEIGLESIPGQGSTFWFFIPCQRISSAPTVNILEYPASKQVNGPTDNHTQIIRGEHKYKVLVAEDNDSNFMLVTALLKKDFEITRAENGAIAVDMMRHESFEAVLMDMKLPLMNGLEATREIRTFDTQTPIIALTAHAFDMDKEAALEAGCNEYITKPINREVLLKALRQICYKS